MTDSTDRLVEVLVRNKMTLREWVETLPSSHPVHKEHDVLVKAAEHRREHPRGEKEK